MEQAALAQVVLFLLSAAVTRDAPRADVERWRVHMHTLMALRVVCRQPGIEAQMAAAIGRLGLLCFRTAGQDARRALADAVARHATEISAWNIQLRNVIADTTQLARLARYAGVRGDLVQEYDPRYSCRCGVEVHADVPWHLCQECVAPLLARGWRRLDGSDLVDCACGDFANGWIGGRSRCVRCALRFVQRR
jgi:hypothetical protein